jgi:hypothetical protein
MATQQPFKEVVATAVETVKAHFPELWPAVDVGLSVCASLLLADNVNPVAVVYVGPAAAGKTTVVNMFADHSLTYVSDSFTPASFVSNAANVSSEQLEKVDLLPRIKHKVLITPELAPVFRGKEDELAKRFATLTRVLDGQGLMTDSGTHGQRGYRGDYLFAWLGCTTPLDSKVWRIMAQLGSRLFFLELGGQGDQKDVQGAIERLMASTADTPYNKRLEECKAVIHRLLNTLYDGREVRGVEWADAQDSQSVREQIARLAYLVAIMRSGYACQNEEEAVAVERPERVYQVLRHIARGHALVHGCTQLTAADLVPVAQVALSTMPRENRRVFLALVQHKELTTPQVMTALQVKHHGKADKVMCGLEGVGIVIYKKPGNGKPSLIHFAPEWEWCLENQWREVFFTDQPIDNTTENDDLAQNGGCERETKQIAQNNLFQRRNDDEKEERGQEGQHSHPPKNATFGKNPAKSQTYTPKSTSRQPRAPLYEELLKMPIRESMKLLKVVYRGRRSS